MADEIIEKPQTPEEDTAPARSKSFVAWVALGLALAAWLILIYGSGFVALPTGIVAAGIAIWGCAVCRGGHRKLSITALIAAAVLVLVVGGFILGISLLR